MNLLWRTSGLHYSMLNWAKNCYANTFSGSHPPTLPTPPSLTLITPYRHTILFLFFHCWKVRKTKSLRKIIIFQVWCLPIPHYCPWHVLVSPLPSGWLVLAAFIEECLFLLVRNLGSKWYDLSYLKERWPLEPLVISNLEEGEEETHLHGCLGSETLVLAAFPLAPFFLLFCFFLLLHPPPNPLPLGRIMVNDIFSLCL